MNDSRFFKNGNGETSHIGKRNDIIDFKNALSHVLLENGNFWKNCIDVVRDYLYHTVGEKVEIVYSHCLEGYE